MPLLFVVFGLVICKDSEMERGATLRLTSHSHISAVRLCYYCLRTATASRTMLLPASTSRVAKVQRYTISPPAFCMSIPSIPPPLLFIPPIHSPTGILSTSSCKPLQQLACSSPNLTRSALQSCTNRLTCQILAPLKYRSSSLTHSLIKTPLAC